jgi:hypothetical protein
MNNQIKSQASNAGLKIDKDTENQLLLNKSLLYEANGIATRAKSLVSTHKITFDQAMLVIAEQRKLFNAGYELKPLQIKQSTEDLNEEVTQSEPVKQITRDKHTDRDNLKLKVLATNNTSGCTGVSWVKKARKWTAYIMKNYKAESLGYYDQWFDAVCARKSAEFKYGYHS